MSGQLRVLIAEDDTRARESLRMLLEEEGYAVEIAEDGAAAATLLSEGAFEAALLDIRMPRKDGLQVLREIHDRPDAPAVLVITAFGNSSVAIEAMKAGAYDYLTKPLRFDEVLIQLERAIEGRRQAQQLASYLTAERDPGEDLVIAGDSAPMQQVYKLIGQVAGTDSTVLVSGESGTGKELVARAIHAHSHRSNQRFVAVNCAAIPETLLESELFGYEKGAFTGAAARRRGRFELAHGGTLFLDEIGEITPATQAKLLRVLQEKTIERLGSEETVSLDVRVIAATNRDLEASVRAGEFREDLFYRLNVFMIRIPALRERREDIPQLAEFLLRKLSQRRRLSQTALTQAALDVLIARDWPGNVRELEHALERALVLSRGGPVSPEHVSAMQQQSSEWCDAAPVEQGLHELVSQLERRLVERALAQCAGNRTRAAELLKINRRLLYDKMHEFRLE